MQTLCVCDSSFGVCYAEIASSVAMVNIKNKRKTEGNEACASTYVYICKYERVGVCILCII